MTEKHSASFVCKSQIDKAESEEDLRITLMIDETMALLVEAGFRKPVAQMKLSESLFSEKF